jgi:hypothetical protein
VTDEAGTTRVWAVVYGNYEPYEVNSLWTTEELARRRAGNLGGTFRAEPMTVWSTPDQGVEP